MLLCCALPCLEPQPGLESHYSFPVNSSPVRLQSRAGSHGRAEQDNRKVEDLQRNMKRRSSESNAVVQCSAPGSCGVMGTAEIPNLCQDNKEGGSLTDIFVWLSIFSEVMSHIFSSR